MSTLAELERQAMTRLKLEVLEENRHLLCSDLNPSRHFSFLRPRGVLVRDEEEQIGNICRNENTAASTRKFLDIISTKTEGFDGLCAALVEDGTQIHLLEALNRSLELAIQRYRQSHDMVFVAPTSNIALSLPLPDDDDDDHTLQINALEETENNNNTSSLSASENSEHSENSENSENDL